MLWKWFVVFFLVLGAFFAGVSVSAYKQAQSEGKHESWADAFDAKVAELLGRDKKAASDSADSKVLDKSRSAAKVQRKASVKTWNSSVTKVTKARKGTAVNAEGPRRPLREPLSVPEGKSHRDGRYAEGASGGIGDGLSGLYSGGLGGIATKARGTIKTPSAHDIGLESGSSRSAADIMKVVRQRTPGLRHIYNEYLKKKPGFAGKVTLRFTIAPGGDIINISTQSSTTGYGEFDNAVKNTVKRWKFRKIQSGNTTVAIPFTFSE